MTPWLPHLLRLVRYGGVGIAVSLLYSGLVIAAVDVLGFRSPTVASSIAFLLFLPVSFYAHRIVSFHDATPDRRQSYRFAAIAVCSFIAAVAGMKLITDLWKLHYLFGIAFAWIVVPASNFAINSLWVFPVQRSAMRAIRAENLTHREADR